MASLKGIIIPRLELTAAVLAARVDVINNEEAIVSNERWLSGPGFLWKEKSSWPTSPRGLDGDPREENPEVKRTVRAVLVSDDRDPLTTLFQHFSCWYRLCRAVA